MSYDIPYMWNLKRNDTNELSYKTETDLENELIVARGREGTVRGLGKVIWGSYTLLY